jgi:hypothetical protein
VAEAEGSLRITRNRNQAGINNVRDLLRTEAAVLDQPVQLPFWGGVSPLQPMRSIVFFFGAWITAQ